jgi:hypothetical protein
MCIPALLFLCGEENVTFGVRCDCEGRGFRVVGQERLYIDNRLPLTVELFRQLAFFILSCKPISYCRFKRIDVYIL